MNRQLAILILLLTWPMMSTAATFTAASAAWSGVNTAYGLTSSGDTLNIPAGIADWTGHQITINHGITIEGAGTNQTFLTNSDNHTFFYINTSNTTQLVTLGNTSLNQPDNLVHPGQNHIQIDNNAYFYIHNINFTNGYTTIRCGYGQSVGQRQVGCIAGCVFADPDISISLNGNVNIGLDPIIPGTTNAVVIENCYFVQDAGANTDQDQEPVQSGQGIRMVLRYSTFNYTNWLGGVYWNPVEWHGFGGFGGENTSWWTGEGTSVGTYAPHFTNDTECLRGPPLIECYSNLFITGSSMTGGRTFHHRGGSALIYGNSIIGPNASSVPMVQMDNDSITTGFFTNWSRIDSVENSYYWSNTVNGVLADSSFYTQNAGVATNGQDYFLSPPKSSGQGAITWTDFSGGHVAAFASGASPYFPYTPLQYPYPLVSVTTNSSNPATTSSGGLLPLIM